MHSHKATHKDEECALKRCLFVSRSRKRAPAAHDANLLGAEFDRIEIPVRRSPEVTLFLAMTA
jgi:hypothetical protein